MSPKQLRVTLKFSLILLTLLIGGCALNMPQPGAIANPEARHPVVDGTVNKGVLETNDLVMAYSLSTAGAQYTLEGNLYLDGRIINSFPLVRSFVLKMSFLDDQGSVLTTANISPLLGHYTTVPDVIKLTDSGSLPSGTKGIAFNYFGEFIDGMNDRQLTSWDIIYSPFAR